MHHKDITYKVLLVGDMGTGKTSLLKRVIHNIFSPHYKTTIGVDFALKIIEMDDGSKIKLQFWDIAGQERFSSSMTRVYYKDAVAAFVVFDITRETTTLDGARKWKQDIDAKVMLPNSDTPIPTILLANKIDLFTPDDYDTHWGKSSEDMDLFCQTNGFTGWFETTALDGSHKGMTNATAKLLQLIKSAVPEEPVSWTNTHPIVDINPEPVKNTTVVHKLKFSIITPSLKNLLDR